MGSADYNVTKEALRARTRTAARYLTGNTLFVDGGAHINGVAWAPELGD